MRIPEVREALWAITERADCPPVIREEVRALIPELFRRTAKRLGPQRSKSIYEVDKKAVRQFAKEHPNMLLRDIGRRFGIDGGRVSEILHGFRD